MDPPILPVVGESNIIPWGFFLAVFHDSHVLRIGVAHLTHCQIQRLRLHLLDFFILKHLLNHARCRDTQLFYGSLWQRRLFFSLVLRFVLGIAMLCRTVACHNESLRGLRSGGLRGCFAGVELASVR